MEEMQGGIGESRVKVQMVLWYDCLGILDPTADTTLSGWQDDRMAQAREAKGTPKGLFDTRILFG